MSFFLANPAGLWCLLGIPAVLAIHLIQQKTKRRVVSTLFLLEMGNHSTISGRSVSKPRSSLSMWLQIAAVAVLSVLLSEPRFTSVSRAQRVIVVLDDSFSMRAFRPQTRSALASASQSIGRAAETTEWLVMASDPMGRDVYDGRSRNEMLAAIDDWIPSSPGHDPGAAIERARRSRGRSGRILFVTDHPREVSPDVMVLSVGESIANTGIAGSTIGPLEPGGHRIASILVKNHSDSEAQREWWLEAGDRVSAKQSFSIAPRGIVSIRAAMPGDVRSAVFRLSVDGFPLDDALPLLVDRPKELRLGIAGDFPDPHLARRIIGTIEAASEARLEDSHLAFATVPSNGRAAIVAPPPSSAGPRIRRVERVTAPRGSIAHGLQWEGLIAASLGESSPGSTILWQGASPLASISGLGAESSLHLNFDLAASNAAKLPSFVLLVSRFVESVRGALPLYQERSYDLSEPLTTGYGRDLELEHRDIVSGATLKHAVPAPEAAFLRAPATPGFFVVRSGDTELLRGASQFADPGEADLSLAASSQPLLASGAPSKARTERDALRALWLLVLAALCAGSWLADRAPKLEGGPAR